MQLTLHILSLKPLWDAIHGFLGQRSATKKYLHLHPEKNLGFQLLSPKTRRRRSLVHRKFRPRTITTLLNELTKKQTDPTNVFVENKLRNYET